MESTHFFSGLVVVAMVTVINSVSVWRVFVLLKKNFVPLVFAFFQSIIREG